MRIKKISKDFTVGVILAVIFISIFGLYQEFKSPTPYQNVNIDVFEVHEEHVFIEVTFEKIEGCLFQDLVAVGGNLGVFRVLPWEDVEEELGDRIAGYHTIRLNIFTDGVNYDRIELRTRHYCGGRTTDRTLAAQDL